MDLGISIDELKQTVTGVVTQRLVSVVKTKSPELSAIYEIIADDVLEGALLSISEGNTFKVPVPLTLSYQIERGIREGVIKIN